MPNREASESMMDANPYVPPTNPVTAAGPSRKPIMLWAYVIGTTCGVQASLMIFAGFSQWIRLIANDTLQWLLLIALFTVLAFIGACIPLPGPRTLSHGKHRWCRVVGGFAFGFTPMFAERYLILLGTSVAPVLEQYLPIRVVATFAAGYAVAAVCEVVCRVAVSMNQFGRRSHPE